jgi:poly-gamma-glutamate capsule biosynthesis protein CapA/YwtB (metallophosphatase superfamily)
LTSRANVRLAAVVALLALGGGADAQTAQPGKPGWAVASGISSRREVRLLAFGDVNFGRTLGKMLLKGDTLYPFRKLSDTLAAYDVVFANLESSLSDQKGETEDPHNNYVFTGPPLGAWSLRRGGVTVVATANNHALDYGIRGLRETLENLDSAGIIHAGSGRTNREAYEPALFSVNGVSIALFACTGLMNTRPPKWDTLVAYSDTARLFPRIRAWQDSADFVILSYHGGEEYTDRPAAGTIAFTRAAAKAGVDLVLGHHPHVPHGLVREGGSVIAHSLGNCVFEQPSRFWTRHGLALAVRLIKDGAGTTVEVMRCLPVRCGYQPEILPPGPDAARVLDRAKHLSTGAAEEWFTWRSH